MRNVAVSTPLLLRQGEVPKRMGMSQLTVPMDRQLDRRVRKSRQALRSALQELLLEQPFEQISMQEIAERADVAYTTFFRNYADKDALLGDLAQTHIDRLLDLSLPLFSANDSTVSTLRLCEYVAEHDKVWTALLTGGAAAQVRKLFIQRTDAQADRWPAQPTWLPPAFGTTVLCSITFDLLAIWLSKERQRTTEEIAAMLARFFRVIDEA
ncbi:TetR/AcrR family transcriptional regulator [Novosphingobium malaysiense]|uniref:TetR/AcrR family transcriptional regulator n=1 Tax=Novosphingobium malaysiense TaxID=1348853 RepID=UPI0018CD2862|nr:TetR/AcrR family transcriptional regulator [Novosphingobium malaysiense]